jgi:spermidine/putrescine-binding protein
VVLSKAMKKPAEIDTSIIPITLNEFLESYNKNMPANFPRASVELLKKFKEEHSALFKNGNFWSLDQHRKKLMDWLPLNSKIS